MERKESNQTNKLSRNKKTINLYDHFVLRQVIGVVSFLMKWLVYVSLYVALQMFSWRKKDITVKPV